MKIGQFFRRVEPVLNTDPAARHGGWLRATNAIGVSFGGSLGVSVGVTVGVGVSVGVG
jgi:hypothetical protein